jgi:hypothetical protein
MVWPVRGLLGYLAYISRNIFYATLILTLPSYALPLSSPLYDSGHHDTGNTAGIRFPCTFLCLHYLAVCFHCVLQVYQTRKPKSHTESWATNTVHLLFKLFCMLRSSQLWWGILLYCFTTNSFFHLKVNFFCPSVSFVTFKTSDTSGLVTERKPFL